VIACRWVFQCKSCIVSYRMEAGSSLVCTKDRKRHCADAVSFAPPATCELQSIAVSVGELTRLILSRLIVACAELGLIWPVELSSAGRGRTLGSGQCVVDTTQIHWPAWFRNDSCTGREDKRVNATSAFLLANSCNRQLTRRECQVN